MLIFTRHPGQTLTLQPGPSLDLNTPVERVFAEGPVRVEVLCLQGAEVSLGIAAPVGLFVQREECNHPPAITALSVAARLMLTRKLKVLMFLKLHTVQSLAAATDLAPGRV